MPTSSNHPPLTSQPSGDRASPALRADALDLLHNVNWLLPSLAGAVAYLGANYGYRNVVYILHKRCSDREIAIRPLTSYGTEADWLNSVWNDCIEKYDFLHVGKRSPFTQAGIEAARARFLEEESNAVPGRQPEPGKDSNHLNFEAGVPKKVSQAFRPWALAARPLARAASAAGSAAQELERKLAVAERFE
ncbi:MAG: hypothetical protein M1826_001217 [Phylliscum demangeonii]|nr:MAG: hypothetical protein M1826_001217 [Phylliscum demangeonii]